MNGNMEVQRHIELINSISSNDSFTKNYRIIVHRNNSKLSQGYRTSEIVKIKWRWYSNQK